MSGVTKIEIAQAIFLKKLKDIIVDLILDTEDPKFLADLKDGTRIYVQYNENDQ